LVDPKSLDIIRTDILTKCKQIDIPDKILYVEISTKTGWNWNEFKNKIVAAHDELDGVIEEPSFINLEYNRQPVNKQKYYCC